MRYKSLWLLLSLLVVMATVATACGPAAATPPGPSTPAPTPGTPTPVPAPTTPTQFPAEKVTVKLKKLDGTIVEKVMEKPKYGGSFVYAMPTGTSILNFDDDYAPPFNVPAMLVVNEDLVTPAYERGPTGTGEIPQMGVTTFQEKYAVGRLAESWEYPDRHTIIFNLRKGIHWALNPKSEASRLVNGRELDAEDVASSITKGFTNPQTYALFQYMPQWFISANATDKYTVVVKGNDDSPVTKTPTTFENMAALYHIKPREVVAKYGHMQDWKNSVGTGPFMLTDYVAMSSFSYERNPNYWGKDPFFPENQLPYIDSFKSLVIPDVSTQIAAIRTAKVDLAYDIYIDDYEVLKAGVSELKFTRYLLGGRMVDFRVDKPELATSKKAVRRALTMATNLQSIKDDFYKGEAELIAWPMTPIFPDYYIPFDQLPDSVKELYSYNPTKAKQMLADAGYPNGFTTEMMLTKDWVDVASIVKDNWSKIGVTLNLDVRESAVFTSAGRAFTHKEQYFGSKGLGGALKMTSLRSVTSGNYGRINDPFIDGKYLEAWSAASIKDESIRIKALQDLWKYAMDEAYLLVMPTPYVYAAYWPWLKQYSGEKYVGYYDFDAAKYLWIDQDLRKAMIGK